MTLLEAYKFLLMDSFMTSLLFPMQTNLALPAMSIFGGYNIILMVAVATVGITIGAVANWVLGRVIVISVKYQPENDRAMKLVNFCKNRSVWILLLSWIPILGSVFVVALGAVGAKFRMLVPMVFAVNLVYCLMIVLILKGI